MAMLIDRCKFCSSLFSVMTFPLPSFFCVLPCFVNLCLGVFVSQMKFSLSNSKLRPQLFHLNYGRELVIKF